MKLQEAIKEKTVIHCATENESDRILKMADKLGYGWEDGDRYIDYNVWSEFESDTCYDIYDGKFSSIRCYADDYTIIPSTEIESEESVIEYDISDVTSTDKTKIDLGGDTINTQVGGNHYSKMKIQPIEFIMANNIPFCEGNVIKYITRYRGKGGVDDLKKARHYIDMLIENYKD